MLFTLFLRGESPAATAEEAIPLVAAIKPGGGLDSSKPLDRSRTLYDIFDATDAPRGREDVAGLVDSAPALLSLAPSGSAMVVGTRPRLETGTMLFEDVADCKMPDSRCSSAN